MTSGAIAHGKNRGYDGGHIGGGGHIGSGHIGGGGHIGSGHIGGGGGGGHH